MAASQLETDRERWCEETSSQGNTGGATRGEKERGRREKAT